MPPFCLQSHLLFLTYVRHQMLRSCCSIEDAKQKSEYDKMMKLAEEKKKKVRHTIQGFREQFQKLIEKNNDLPPHLRLDR